MNARRISPFNARFFSPLLLIAGVLGWAPAFAAVTCVSTPLQLAIALFVAQNNGEDDFIQLEVGTYNLGGELDYFAATSETYALAINGGWAPGCNVRATSGSSVLDGQNAVRPLYIDANGNVSIFGLTFAHGNPAQYAGGALNVTGPAGAVVAIDYNSFVANSVPATNSGGAIFVSSPGTILMRNNLFYANQGTNTLYLVNDGIADLNNNTIVGNQLANHVGLGALDLAGSGTYYISNNLLWNNEGNDLYDQSGAANFSNNDIGVRDGFPPASESNALSVDPQFGLLSVHPGLKSRLINAGLDTPYGGIGSEDLAFGERLIGKHVDIGAYESEVLFANGFQ
ncbi:MAG: hypothetical protein WBV39_14790 [Rudaea sp.]